MNNNQHHKNLLELLPSKVTSLGAFVEFTKGAYYKKLLQKCY